MLASAAMIATIVGVIVGFLLGEIKDWRKSKTDIGCVKLALKVELETLLKIYEPLKILSAPPHNGDDIKIVRLNSDYTAVYTNNADKLGTLGADVAQPVVIAYTNIAALIDCLTVYAYRWEHMIANQRTGSDVRADFTDVVSAHTAAYIQQEITLSVVRIAIEKLS